MSADEEKTEADLMLVIACYLESDNVSEKREANAAFEVLYERHRDTVGSFVGSSVAKYSTFNFDPDEIEMRIWEVIWRKSETFAPDSDDPEVIKKVFFGWVSTIRKNLFADAVRSVKEDFDYDSLNGIAKIISIPEKEDEGYSEAVHQLASALSKLNPGEQEILRSLAQNAPLDGGELRTNPDELKDLASHLGVTVASIRVKRQRAITRLKKELENQQAIQFPVEHTMKKDRHERTVQNPVSTPRRI